MGKVESTSDTNYEVVLADGLPTGLEKDLEQVNQFCLLRIGQITQGPITPRCWARRRTGYIH